MRKIHFIPFGPLQDQEDVQVQHPQTERTSLAEQDTVLLAVLHGPTSTLPHKVGASLSSTVRHMISAGFARLQEPQPEGPSTRGLKAAKPGPSLGKLPILVLTNAAGLLIVSFSYYISVLQYGKLAFEFSFLFGLLLMFVPNLLRLLSPASSRFERICLLCILGLCFYLVQFMISPLYFASFDGSLHWRTADDILRTRHLFSENSMLPVSPYFPGLEMATNALTTISGLNTFYAGIVIISASRLLMTLSLFLFYEQVTQSSRMAGIATIIYMVNPHFLLFDAAFSYETLALPLATFMFYILSRYQIVNKNYLWILFTASIVLLAVTITHHMTDYFFDGLLVLWATVSLWRASSRNVGIHLAAIALLGVLLSFAYALFKGNPVWEYLSEYYAGAFKELGHIIAGTSTARPLFTSQGASPTPIWDRILMTASVGLVALGLPFGLLSLWQRHRHYAPAIMLGIASFAYPVTQVFRFTDFGAEITDRSAAFLFLPIAYVLTILITHFWPTRTLSWRAISLISCAISVVFLGGIILESGPTYSSFPGPYTVVADGRSVEPEGIQASTWALAYLGPDNRVGTDRINQMLLHTFGDQRVVTSLDDKVDVASVFFSPNLGPAEIATLRSARVHYLVVDLRLSTSLPLEGFYFESDEPDAFHHRSPISRTALTKFSAIPQINRVFDSGNIVMYDTGVLVDAFQKP